MIINRRHLLAGAVAAGVGGVAGIGRRGRRGSAQGAAYELTDLFVMDEPRVQGSDMTDPGSLYALNEAGEIGGGIAQSTERMSPAVWTAEGKRTRFKSGPFGGEVFALNNTGLAVGVGHKVPLGYDPFANSPFSNFTPAAWQDTEPVELPPPASVTGDWGGAALAVNDDGVIVGSIYDLVRVSSLTAVWRDGVGEELEQPPNGTGSVNAMSINASGVIAGSGIMPFESASGPVAYAAVTWTDGTLEMLDIPDEWLELGSGGHYVTNALISDDGLVAAGYFFGDRADVYVYDRGQPTRLESPSADHPFVLLNAISRSGLVAGTAQTPDMSETILVVWQDGTPIDLSESLAEAGDLTIRNISAINNDGVILLQGYGPNDETHALILTPA